MKTNPHTRLELGDNNSETQNSRDPRRGCCWEGKYFFDAFKAIIVRQMFMIHVILAIWRVTVVTSEMYWLFCTSLVTLLIETGVILLKRRGQEWSWYVGSILKNLDTADSVQLDPPISTGFGSSYDYIPLYIADSA